MKEEVLNSIKINSGIVEYAGDNEKISEYAKSEIIKLFKNIEFGDIGKAKQFKIEAEFIDNESFNIVFSIIDGYNNKSIIKMNIFRQSLLKLVNSINDSIDSVVKECKALDIFNEALSENFRGKDECINVCFKIGSNLSYCEVEYWDYNSIVIGASKAVMSNLKQACSEGGSKELVKIASSAEDYPNVIVYLRNFCDSEVNKMLGAIIDTHEIEAILTKNMLSTSEVIGYIKKNKDSLGKQRITSTVILKELGRFAIILKWDVDYVNKKVDVKIMEDKVIDLENNRFISERNLYSRIENRVLLSIKDISIF